MTCRRRIAIAVGALAVNPFLLPLPASAAAVTCATTLSDRDLNGDGYDDAVVGDPFATVSGRTEAGAIVVLYGDADGRIGEGLRVVLTQASVPGSSVESGDHFGWSVAMDDSTGDGCADILVGSPGEDWSGHADAGIAHLISFVPDGRGGPGRATAQVADQSDVAGAVETGDQFGYAVALSNVRAGDEPLGAIGAPGEDLRGVGDAGVVNTFSSFASPFLADQREQGRLGDRWLPGTAQAGDRFGASVLIAPLHVTDGDDTGVELTFVAGAPGDTVGGVDNAGSVTSWEPITGFDQLVTQDSAGVPGKAEAGDEFGYSLGFSEPSSASDAVREVVVGSPGEDVGSAEDAGSVTLFADDVRVGMTRGRALTQDTTGFAGTVEPGDRFGHSIALRSDGADGSLLLIGAPYEDLGAVGDAGLVQTAAISSDGDGVAAVRSYTENSAGTPGTVAAGNRFGRTVAVMQGLHERVVAISSPHASAGSVFLVNQDGVTRAWVPGQGGVPFLSSGRFGWSLAGEGGR